MLTDADCTHVTSNLRTVEELEDFLDGVDLRTGSGSWMWYRLVWPRRTASWSRSWCMTDMPHYTCARTVAATRAASTSAWISMAETIAIH